jgi:hypothetical protein
MGNQQEEPAYFAVQDAEIRLQAFLQQFCRKALQTGMPI